MDYFVCIKASIRTIKKKDYENQQSNKPQYMLRMKATKQKKKKKEGEEEKKVSLEKISQN